jgi:hypothetical protein
MELYWGGMAAIVAVAVGPEILYWREYVQKFADLFLQKGRR